MGEEGEGLWGCAGRQNHVVRQENKIYESILTRYISTGCYVPLGNREVRG